MIRAFLLMLLLFLPTICFGDEVSDLVDGVVARSTAIKSGRLTYDRHKGFPANKSDPLVNDLPGSLSGLENDSGAKTPSNYFSWSGTSWAEGGRSASGKKDAFGFPVRTNHDGYYIEGVSGYGMMKEVPFNRKLQHAPIWAGAFKDSDEEQFFKTYRDRFKAIPDKDIDGVPSKGIELRAEDFQKNERYPFRNPVTNIYIAPQMGYVITAVEGLTRNGVVFRRDWNTDWHEVAPKIFMPFKMFYRDGAEARDQNGVNDKVTRKNDYIIFSATLINEPIPDDDFRAKVEAGQAIVDRRDPKHSIRVTTKEDSSSETWDKLLEEERERKAGQRRAKEQDKAGNPL